MIDFVAYYRVSTAKQGRSGLGLAAQREKVLDYVGRHGTLIAEFTEIESGRRDDRRILHEALALARSRQARLVIARLDRFSRRVSFISGIMEKGVGLTVADMPDATEFQLHIFAALAQEERRLISERTKAALAEAKKRGVRLGANGAVLALRNKERALARRSASGLDPALQGFSEYRRKRLRPNGLPADSGSFDLASHSGPSDNPNRV